VRTSDTVARLGGDEFVLLIDNPENQEEVAHLADRVIAAIKLPPSLQNTDARIGASIGIAMLGVHTDSVDQLMKNADSAMYAAKAAGKNRYTFFTPAMSPDR
jgi:diguanylate cyclase (GGDEF)-like protein